MLERAQNWMMLKASVTACSLGLALGFLFGAVTNWLLPTGGTGAQSNPIEIVQTVNERTGKPQLHLQGKPEIK